MSDCTFISYAREDQGFVFELAITLKERGVPVWLDQWDISAGADWDQTIDSALHECSQFLIVLSPAAVASKQVRGELQTALDENKAVVPVVYQTCPIPRQLRLIQHIDFTAHGLHDEPTIDQLVRALHVPQAVPPSLRGRPSNRESKRRRLLLLAGGLSAVVLVVGSLWWYPHWQQSAQEAPSGPPPEEASPRPPALQGNLQVNVNVDAAKVSIDGVDVGVARHAAPLFLRDVKVGQHRLGIEAEGYEPQERRVNIVANEWTQVGFVLKRRVP